MKPLLPLFIFIDACGWEIIKNDPFARDFAPHRRRLTSVFGYSSACVPSILSGRWPVEHRNWCYFVYDPAKSPFRKLKPLQWLPRRITSRRIFRRWLTQLLKARLGFKGYFDLYNIPFKHISLFDFTEKKSPLRPGGMNRGRNICDFLEEHRICYHMSSPERNEEENLAALMQDVEAERVDFAFLYWPGLDGLLHRVGNQAPEIPVKLRAYEQSIHELLKASRNHYEEVRLYLFSDHGMANCDVHVDLKSMIEALPLRLGRDYAAVYDSTMARFWFLNASARQSIEARLARIPEGRVLPDAELEAMGTLFPDRYFGELIFLVKEGVLIVPSDMGERPIRAMHGYHPGDKHSFAALCSNQSHIPHDIEAIPDVFRLMTRDAQEAKARNKKTARVVDQTGAHSETLGKQNHHQSIAGKAQSSPELVAAATGARTGRPPLQESS